MTPTNQIQVWQVLLTNMHLNMEFPKLEGPRDFVHYPIRLIFVRFHKFRNSQDVSLEFSDWAEISMSSLMKAYASHNKFNDYFMSYFIPGSTTYITRMKWNYFRIFKCGVYLTKKLQYLAIVMYALGITRMFLLLFMIIFLYLMINSRFLCSGSWPSVFRGWKYLHHCG